MDKDMIKNQNSLEVIYIKNENGPLKDGIRFKKFTKIFNFDI